MSKTVNGMAEPREAGRGPWQEAVSAALARLAAERIVARIWARDTTVWRDRPEGIVDRLGWLDSPAAMRAELQGIEAFAAEIREAEWRQGVLMGMGGSSLAPEMFRRVFGTRRGYPDLRVLDTIDPDAVLAVRDSLDWPRTLFVVSTKSGGTIETLSLFKYFYTEASGILGPGEAGRHFAGVTDPGTSLQAEAARLGFRRVFLNDPHIGGRYSAFSCFGLVPAALIGVPVQELLSRADRATEACRDPDPRHNPGAWLGGVLGALALAGRDKLTLILPERLRSFGAWVEQLIAESTGKEGRGIVPVHGEPLGTPEHYGPDRIFIQIRLAGEPCQDLEALAQAGHPVLEWELAELLDLGAEIFRWEFATAVAGHVLGINPFDQPDVESAKVRAREMIGIYVKRGRLPEEVPLLREDGLSVYGKGQARSVAAALEDFLRQGKTGAYAALQLYVNPLPELEAACAQLREMIRNRFGWATTCGYGPGFLHSTGQLHKGGGGQGLFLQVTAEPSRDAGIPDEPGSASAVLSFETLKRAQALGDRLALEAAGRRVLRVHIHGEARWGVEALLQSLKAESW